MAGLGTFAMGSPLRINVPVNTIVLGGASGVGAAVIVAVGDGRGAGGVAVVDGRAEGARAGAAGAGTRPASPTPVVFAFEAITVAPVTKAAKATTVPGFTETVGEGMAGVGAGMMARASVFPLVAPAGVAPDEIVPAGRVPAGGTTGALTGTRCACVPPAWIADAEPKGGVTATGDPTEGVVGGTGTPFGPRRLAGGEPRATGAFGTGLDTLAAVGGATGAVGDAGVGRTGETLGTEPTLPTGFGELGMGAAAALGWTGRGATVGTTGAATFAAGLTGVATIGLAGATTTGFAGAATIGLSGTMTGGGMEAGLGRPGVCAKALVEPAASPSSDTPIRNEVFIADSRQKIRPNRSGRLNLTVGVPVPLTSVFVATCQKS